MPRMERLLALRERHFDRCDQPDVFVDSDAKGEYVLLGLTLVELTDAELEIGQRCKRYGEGDGKFDR